MKKIIIILLAVFTAGLVSCKKDGKEGDTVKNSYRVKRIAGNNAQWGSFELLFYYSGEKLDSVWRRDMSQQEGRRDTLGRFSVSYDNTSTSLSIVDYVLNIDADSLAKLREAYPQSYSDSLRRRRVGRNLFSRSYIHKDSYMTSSLYAPREDVGTGDEFNNRYKSVYTKRNLFEYDGEGRLVIHRRFVDAYAQDQQNTDYERSVDKFEYAYSGDRPIAASYYVQDSYNPESWRHIYECRYAYSGDQLTSIEAEGYSWVRSGSSLTITDAQGVTRCTLDGNGNITAITYPDGSQISVEYEAGHGNVSQLLYPPDYELMGKALIK